MTRLPPFHLAPIVLGLTLLSGAGHGAAPAPAAQEQPAFDILHQQAQYWVNRGRGDLAIGALQRILASDPNNARGLYEIGLLLIGEGDITSARTFEARLRRQERSLELASQLRREIDNAEVDRSLLNEARRRAVEGDADVALGLYEKLFAGREIGGRLAVEYYETLAAMETRWDEAADGLRGQFERQPSNGRVRMALAKVLSYREESRREALFHFSNLLDDSAFHDEALAAMRDALLWLNASPDDQDYYNRYLNIDQDDAVAEKLALALNPKVIDAFTAARIDAYKALNQGQLSLAQQRFTDLLSQRSNDAESLGGLGLVHLRRQQFGAAADYLTRAIRADAGTRRNFGNALDESRFWGAHAQVTQKIGQQSFEEATALVNRIEARTPDRQAHVHMLHAGIAAAKGDWGLAAQHSRSALSIDRHHDGAAALLLDALARQQRYDELDATLLALEQRAATGAFKDRAVRAAMRRARGRLASHLADSQTAVAAYEQALNADGADPWVRLEYARLLLGLDRRREAEAVIAGLTGDASKDAAHALALYYNDVEDWERSLAALERVPTPQQPSAMKDLAAIVRVKHRIDLALQRAEMGDRNTAISEMMALQEGPQTPAKTIVLADGMLRLDLTEQAGLMVSRALNAQRVSQVDHLMQFARILGESGELNTAYRLITDLMLRRHELSSAQREGLASVYDDILLRASRQAISEGQFQLALSYLEPVHRANPLNGAALRYLGEVHQRMGEYDAAINFYQRAMTIDPDDLWAVKGAVGAALDSDDIETASGLLDVALNRFPEHPDIYTLISRTAHSANDLEMAIEAAEKAERLQRSSPLPVVEQPYERGLAPGERLPRISPTNPFRTEARSDAEPARKRLAGANSAAANSAAMEPWSSKPKPAWHEGWQLVRVAHAEEASAPSSHSADAEWMTLPEGATLGEMIQAEIDATRRAMTPRPGNGTTMTAVSQLPAGLELSTIEQLAQILAADGKHEQVERVVLGVLDDESLDAASAQRMRSLLYPSAMHLAEQALLRLDYPATLAHVAPLLEQPEATRDVRIATLMARYSRGVGDLDKAAAFFDAALELTPANESLRLDAALMQIEAGDLARANALAVAGLELRPQSARLHFLVGRIAKSLGDLDAAMEHFLMARRAELDGHTDVPHDALAPMPPAAASEPAGETRRLAALDQLDEPHSATIAVRQPVAAPSPGAPAAIQRRLETLDLDGYPWPADDRPGRHGLARSIEVAAVQPNERVSSPTSQIDIRERLRNLGREGSAGREPSSSTRQSVLSESLDSELESLRAEASAFFSQSLSFRYRSGEEGLSKLTEFRAPFELDFNPYVGRLKLVVEPVYLTTGTFGDDPNRSRRYGTFALVDEEARFAPADDDAGGVGMNFGYTTGAFTIDVGTTPLDFEVLNLIGGLQLAHEFDSGFEMGLDLSRRPVTESLLSYGGAVDPLTGIEWGGVTNNEITLDVGQAFGGFSVYADGWYGINTGRNIEDNENFGGDFGFTVDLLARQGRHLQAGFNTTYFSYDKNLRFFTLGHGGYFSPQRFFSSSIPVEYEFSNDQLQLRFAGAISVQHFSEDAAFYFPSRGDLQEELFEFEAEQDVIHEGQTQTDLGFRASGELIYRITPRLQFQGFIGVERAADWTESFGKITVQYRPGV